MSTTDRKLVIQIPCFNEEQTLAITLAAIPKTIAGFSEVEILVIDDGSTDRTVEVARANAVSHLLILPSHLGLAQAFMAGLLESLKLGAHTIVNLDADNQYCADDIIKLVEPILAGRSEVVIGERPLAEMQQFSTSKKALHQFGNRFIRAASSLPVRDATTGFRALRYDAAEQIHIYSTYSYTIEMLLQLAHRRIRVSFVPIRVNPGTLRPSRLMKSSAQYLWKTAAIILRSQMLYRPLPLFFWSGSVLLVIGIALYLFLPTHRVWILFFAANVGLIFFVAGLLGESLKANRTFLEKISREMGSGYESDAV